MYEIVDRTNHANGLTLKRAKSRGIKSIKYVMVHHSASSKLAVQNLINSHLVQDHKWPLVGYHYYVTKESIIYKLSDILKIVNGCKNHNTNTLHICYEGNYEEEEFNLNFPLIFRTILRDLPCATGNLKLLHHGEKRNTLCCGKNLIREVEEFRRRGMIQNGIIWPELEL